MTYEDLKRFHAMLVETTGLVRKAIADGKSLADVKAAGLPEAWKEWGGGFINTSRWLEISYNSLKSAPLRRGCVPFPDRPGGEAGQRLGASMNRSTR